MIEASSTRWGDASRHYAAMGSEHGLRPSEAKAKFAETWAGMLESAAPGIRQAVVRTCKRWNGVVRDCIRAATGLRLSIGDDTQAIPVRIVDGMPRLFEEKLQAVGELGWAMLNRPFIEAAVVGTTFLVEHHDVAAWVLAEGAPAAERQDCERVRATATALLRILDQKQLVEQLIGIDEDVLGAYFFRIPEVRLYWIPIAIISSMLGLRPEALVIVVLAHELAHAYTHRGRDIDGESWDTEAFARAEVPLVEGLAQFYTSRTCELLEQRFPDALPAYEKLLMKQSPAYRAHLDWVAIDERGGEIIRVAMIECRSRRLIEAERFAEAISRHRQQVKGRARQAGQGTTLGAGRQ